MLERIRIPGVDAVEALTGELRRQTTPRELDRPGHITEPVDAATATTGLP